jgi:hypothetical protein
MSIPFYQLVFTDDTAFNGGDLDKTFWRESPEKPIKSFRLRLPTGDFLYIGGYEEYNFFIEATQNIYGNTKKQLCYIYVMGLEKDMVTSYRIALSDYGQYKPGDMTVRRYPKDKEYNGKPTTGWRKGCVNKM